MSKVFDENCIKLLPPSFSQWSPTNPPDRQVSLLISGGVDSSVTAYLLKETGWDVLAITMKVPVHSSTSAKGCCGADAAFLCHQLGIPHYFINVRPVFDKYIIEPFQQCYLNGRTPNPCVDCNTFIKFFIVWDFLEKQFGIKRISTGHYARIIESSSKFYLARAYDKDKDQSYFLYGIPRDRLPFLVLPMGQLTKQTVRSIAREIGLVTADKSESMELCFTDENDYRSILPHECFQPGDIRDTSGRKIGTHRGIANYTIGQRRGIGLTTGKPLYVTRINADSNTIVLGTREEASCHIVAADNMNILIPEELRIGARIYGKIRSYGEPQPCSIKWLSDDDIEVEFEQLQFAPCPGQRLVIYNDLGYVIAGATIK